MVTICNREGHFPPTKVSALITLQATGSLKEGVGVITCSSIKAQDFVCPCWKTIGGGESHTKLSLLHAVNTLCPVQQQEDDRVHWIHYFYRIQLPAQRETYLLKEKIKLLLIFTKNLNILFATSKKQVCITDLIGYIEQSCNGI